MNKKKTQRPPIYIHLVNVKFSAQDLEDLEKSVAVLGINKSFVLRRAFHEFLQRHVNDSDQSVKGGYEALRSEAA